MLPIQNAIIFCPICLKVSNAQFNFHIDKYSLGENADSKPLKAVDSKLSYNLGIFYANEASLARNELKQDLTFPFHWHWLNWVIFFWTCMSQIHLAPHNGLMTVLNYIFYQTQNA